SWDTASAIFEKSPSPFQKSVKKFITMLEPYRYQIFVHGEEAPWTTRNLTYTGNTFANFLSARYATDVTFQQAHRPMCTFNERTIQPNKRAARGSPLTTEERSENDRISHDRVPVENYFDRYGACVHTSGSGTAIHTTCSSGCMWPSLISACVVDLYGAKTVTITNATRPG
ncbi:hypothetical protein PHMEG_00026484, partial [Phytophthora megakarya]